MNSRIEIRGRRTPYSPRFEDVYFAEDQGIEESQYLYLQGSGFIDSISKPVRSISVGEIGFGVGLNFLLTLKAFKQSAPQGKQLFYFSAEQFPVSLADLQKLYALYPELQPEAQELLDQYPVLTPGTHVLRFWNRRAHLFLMIGEASQQFTSIETPIEHWYWDGFAPSKNPEAFSDSVWAAIQSCSAPNAQGASFSSAGWVRRGLEASQYRVVKRPGFGNKRECIQAFYQGPGFKSRLEAGFDLKPEGWLHPSRHLIRIGGAGLAGSAAARSFAERGYGVEVYEPKVVAARASGNKVGLFNVQLSRKPNPISRFAQSSLIHFLNELKKFAIGVEYGIERDDSSDALALHSSGYPNDFFEPRDQSVFLPQCGILNPPELCRARLDHPNIRIVPSALPNQISPEFWNVVAYGADLHLLPYSTSWYPQVPTRPIRGQILELQSDSQLKALQRTRVHHCYLSSCNSKIAGADVHVLGATYQAKNIQPNQVEIDTDFLLAEARRSWPSLAHLNHSSVRSSREGFRLSTPDKLPMIGPWIDPQRAAELFSSHWRGGRQPIAHPAPVVEGWAVLMGLGSRGITYSSLAAEILAATLCGEPLPIDMDLWPHLSPLRFVARDVRRSHDKVLP